MGEMNALVLAPTLISLRAQAGDTRMRALTESQAVVMLAEIPGEKITRGSTSPNLGEMRR
jgi:hypothetical protein